jgi:hypothetical protein
MLHGMSDFDRQPGAIDDPGMKGGIDPQLDALPPGDSADDTGTSPEIPELDMPGPDDPVAWSYVQPGTEVVGTGGERLGRVAAMLGTEAEGIFHGIALDADHGPDRMIPSDAVRSLTSSRVEVNVAATALADLEPYEPQER